MSGRAFAALGAVLGFAALVASCGPPSDLLCGRWQSRAPANGSQSPSVLATSGVELYLGHFGPEVAGIVRLYPAQFDSDDDCGINDQPAACAYVDNGRWRSGDSRLTFSIDLAAVPGATTCSASRVEFDLTLRDSDHLEGEMRCVDGAALAQPVALERLGCQECVDVLGKEDCP